MNRSEAASRQARWLPVWLALLPPVYVVSPAALLNLGALSALPPPLRALLLGYGASQLLPALFAPQPFLAFLLALMRALLMFALMATGMRLQTSESLRPLAVGLAAIFLTALVWTALSGGDLLLLRLTHPYMTTSTLGMAGALGVWLAAFSPGGWAWRAPLALSGVLVLLASGSRGALLCAVVGLLAGLGGRARTTGARWMVLLVPLLGLGLAGLAFTASREAGAYVLTRLMTADTTGRDLVWDNAAEVIQAHPLAGVGSYQLGRFLAIPGTSCVNFDGNPCPAWAEGLGNPWLIAHNITLQQLAETGPLGLMGLFVLLGALCLATWQRSDPLSLAVVGGFLIASVADNTLLLPSPFFAEVFWMVAGMQLAHLRTPRPLASVLVTGLLLLLSLPALVHGLSEPTAGSAVQTTYLNASPTADRTRRYAVTVRFDLPPGDYRAALDACARVCVPMTVMPYTVSQAGPPILTLSGTLLDRAKQTVRLRLLPGQSRLRLEPLAERRWEVARRDQ